MEMFFLVAQRKSDYHGQYAPEVLEAFTEADDEANPDFRAEKVAEHRQDAEFDRLTWVTAELDGESMQKQVRTDGALAFYGPPQPEGQLGIRVLIGYRAGSYPGEHGPEALAVMDEYGIELNPEYLQQQAAEAQAGQEFEALGFIDLGLDMDGIRHRLYPEAIPMEASLLSPSPA